MRQNAGRSTLLSTFIICKCNLLIKTTYLKKFKASGETARPSKCGNPLQITGECKGFFFSLPRTTPAQDGPLHIFYLCNQAHEYGCIESVVSLFAQVNKDLQVGSAIACIATCQTGQEADCLYRLSCLELQPSFFPVVMNKEQQNCFIHAVQLQTSKA